MLKANNKGKTETKGAFYEEKHFIYGIIAVILAILVELIITFCGFRYKSLHSQHKQLSYSLYFIIHFVFIIVAILHMFLTSYLQDLKNVFYQSYCVLTFLFSGFELFLLIKKHTSSSGLFEAFKIVFGGFAQIIIAKGILELSNCLLTITSFIDSIIMTNIEFGCYFVLTFSTINSIFYAAVRYFDPFQRLVLDANRSHEKILEIKIYISEETKSLLSYIQNILAKVIQNINIPAPDIDIPPIIKAIRSQTDNPNIMISDVKKLVIKMRETMNKIEFLRNENTSLKDLYKKIKQYKGESHSQAIKVEIDDTKRFITDLTNKANTIQSIISASDYYYDSLCLIQEIGMHNNDYKQIYLKKIDDAVNDLGKITGEITEMIEIIIQNDLNKDEVRMDSLFKDATRIQNEMNKIFIILDEICENWKISHRILQENCQNIEKFHYLHIDIVQFLIGGVCLNIKQLENDLNVSKSRWSKITQKYNDTKEKIDTQY